VVLVATLVLISAAVVALAHLFAVEAKRTRDVRVETQMRALLLAGADVARQKVSAHFTSGHFEIAIPEAAQGVLAIDLKQVAAPAQIVAEITARVGTRTTRQDLIFSHARQGENPETSSEWVVTSASMK